MSSISSPSSAVSTLLQALSASSPDLSALFATPGVQTALSNATPQDIVQLSDQAQQLQDVNLLFGLTDSAQADGFPNPGAQVDPLMQALAATLGASGTGSTTSSPLATEAANASSILNLLA